MKTRLLASVLAVGLLMPFTMAQAHVPPRNRYHHTHLRAYPHDGTAAKGYRERAAEPFRTIQPTDVGQGVLAPNGYRGPGTATGGPAGGIDTGGGR